MPADLNLVTTLFEIYMQRFIDWKEALERICNEDNKSSEFALAKKNAQRYEASAMNILKKYACHESLNTAKVLKAFPDSWQLIDRQSYNLMKYLKTVFDHKLTVKENNSIGEGLSSYEHVNIDCELSKKRTAYVKITNDNL